MVGKTNMDQFASGLNGTRSPYGCPANAFDFRCDCAPRHTGGRRHMWQQDGKEARQHGKCLQLQGVPLLTPLERPPKPPHPSKPPPSPCPKPPAPNRLPLPPGSSPAAPPPAPEPSWAWAT